MDKIFNFQQKIYLIHINIKFTVSQLFPLITCVLYRCLYLQAYCPLLDQKAPNVDLFNEVPTHEVLKYPWCLFFRKNCSFSVPMIATLCCRFVTSVYQHFKPFVPNHSVPHCQFIAAFTNAGRVSTTIYCYCTLTLETMKTLTVTECQFHSSSFFFPKKVFVSLNEYENGLSCRRFIMSV